MPVASNANPKPARKQVSVTIDADLAAWLNEEAGRRMVGVAFLVEAAVRDLKATIPPADVDTGMVGA